VKVVSEIISVKLCRWSHLP